MLDRLVLVEAGLPWPLRVSPRSWRPRPSGSLSAGAELAKSPRALAELQERGAGGRVECRGRQCCWKVDEGRGPCDGANSQTEGRRVRLTATGPPVGKRPFHLARAALPPRPERPQNIATSAPGGVRPLEPGRTTRSPAYGSAALFAPTRRRGDHAHASPPQENFATSAPEGVKPQKDTQSSRPHGWGPAHSSTIAPPHLDNLCARHLQDLYPVTFSCLATHNHDGLSPHHSSGPSRPNAVGPTPATRPPLISATPTLWLVPLASPTTWAAATTVVSPCRTSPNGVATSTADPSPLTFFQSQIQGDTSAPEGAGQPGPVEGGRR